ncbi:membrane protein required for colicin V production [Pustulibacterium marinum]|uniref:Membrane protein required for colicin V production n=1 Tax=Pustulibacterium marinum TaxID=1224947 RepID=A0A1I7HHW8_9FLAO|nr:CvpA family protein [Pustulibacterium marinum]SFU60202.1 membrane protein required for colicin V production [Pustulibacterium marinum]
MNYLDIVLGALLLFGLVRGFMKGLLLEIASLVAFILGIYCAIHFSFYVSDYLKPKLDWEESTLNLVAFAIVFIGIAFGIHFIGKLLTKLANAATLGLMNKFLGAIFGFLKIGLVLSALLLFFNSTNNLVRFIDEKTLEDSVLYKPITLAGKFIFQRMIDSEIAGEEDFENIEL